MEALIWGASGGIGSALVTYLKANNWHVFAAARDESRIPPEADRRYHFDAGKPHTIVSIPPLIAPESAGLNLMVYAAGALRSGLLDRLTPDDWAAVMNSNVMGAWLAAQASLPLMNEGAYLLFIGAYVDHVVLPKMGAYAAAKAALDPLVKVLAKENRKQIFTVVRPGPVSTAFWDSAPFKLPKGAKPPQVIAEAILDHIQAGASGDLNL